MKNVETVTLIKEIDSLLANATDPVDIAQLKLLRQWVLNGRN